MAQTNDPYAATAIQPQPDPYAATAVAPTPAGLPMGMSLPQLPAHSPVAMQGSILAQDPDPSPVANFAKGVVKSVPSTLGNIDAGVAKIPVVGSALNTPIPRWFGSGPDAAQATADTQQMGVAHGTAQKAGKFAGNAAQFMIPGGAEAGLAEGAGAAVKAADYAAPLARYIAPTAKAVGAAVGSGVVNKAQGGSFTGGALAGLGGLGVAQGLKYVAPIAAESAMGVRAADRAFGRTPGQSILDETSGVSPGSIAKQAGSKVSLYTGQLNDNALNSDVPVDLQPAKDKATSWMESALLRNNDATSKQVAKIGSQLDARGAEPIPQYVSAHEGLALKRGVDDLKTSQNPATTPDFFNRAVGDTVGAMHPELEAAIPGYRPLNAKISTLLPVQARAASKDLNAGWIQRSMDRFGAHTGALTAPLAAAAYGGEKGGVPGAILGGITGLAGTEILSNPVTRMAAARVAASPLTSRYAIPAAVGVGLQAGRNVMSPAQKKKGLYDSN